MADMGEWEYLTWVWMHDPPDKALEIQAHAARAREYIKQAFGGKILRDDFKKEVGAPDVEAAIAERLPMPRSGKGGAPGVAPEAGVLTVFHPLSAIPHKLPVVELNTSQQVVRQTIMKILDGLSEQDAMRRFFLLWRLLPEKLEGENTFYSKAPAETRVPDHTIWHHNDIAAGIKAASSEGQGAAFLSFQLGPVQPFIEAARSVRDLWSGSAILSWLAFQAMVPIIEALGPTALVYPSLRGAPLMDLWMKKNLELNNIPEPKITARKAPSIPHKFLALVPGVKADSLCAECKKAAKKAWKNLAEEVRKKIIKSEIGKTNPGWDDLWDTQVENYVEFQTAVLPRFAFAKKDGGKDREAEKQAEQQAKEEYDNTIARLLSGKSFAEAFPDAWRVRNLSSTIPVEQAQTYDQRDAGRWQMELALSTRLMEAARSIRHVHPPLRQTNGEIPPKCTLLGTYEQMGPGNLQKSREFWDNMSGTLKINGVRIRKGERLCAVSLAKRFAPPVVLTRKLGLEQPDMFFPDTATVAARWWLKEADLDPGEFGRNAQEPGLRRWNGQWLHWKKPDQDQDEDEQTCPEEVWERICRAKENMREKYGAPPAYYAVLKMDGDHMGKWLRGEKAPRVRDIMHPVMVKYYEDIAGRDHAQVAAVEKALSAKRPLGPAMHAAISEALANFAVHAAPEIIEKHNGVLIYAGGDDLLALLPLETALECARDLRLAFLGHPDENNGAPQGYYRTDGRDLLMMGPKAGISAGMAVVHHKYDLRAALKEAREAEKTAKDTERGILALSICRRSGEHTRALCPWEVVNRAHAWQEAFKSGASDRWTYHLAGERETLSALDLAAMESETARIFARAEKDTREALTGKTEGVEEHKKEIRRWLREYGDLLLPRLWKKAARAGAVLKDSPEAEMFKNFVTLIQSASFLARGRDDR
jgi:CRISPR-associated protein Cmr2